MIRFFDVLLSFIAVVVLTPFMIPIMIGLKLTGEHDIFYRQSRVGKGGKEFKLLKFATMLRNSPNMPGGLYTSKNDPRLLPMGKLLRKTKINELPQLLNILTGQMSVIGYRPIVKSDYDTYPDGVKMVLAKSLPGISGIGSIVFRNEEEICQTFESYEEKEKFYKDSILPYKGQLEVWYAEKKNIALYFRLILMTVVAVFKPESNDWKKLKDLPEIPNELERFLR